MAYYEDILDDPGLVERLDGHKDEMEELSETQQIYSVVVEPLSFAERAVDFYNHHKKGIKQLGALGVGSLSAGFAARGAWTLVHRPAH